MVVEYEEFRVPRTFDYAAGRWVEHAPRWVSLSEVTENSPAVSGVTYAHAPREACHSGEELRGLRTVRDASLARSQTKVT